MASGDHVLVLGPITSLGGECVGSDMMQGFSSVSQAIVSREEICAVHWLVVRPPLGTCNVVLGGAD